jgi:hypothetical protein
MATPTLYTQDLMRGQYAQVQSTSTGFATAPNALDGDVANRWSAGATSGIFVWGQSTAYAAIGWALSNHNLNGATITVSWATTAAGTYTQVDSITVSGNGDFVRIVNLGQHQYWKFAISGASAAITIGEISLLADYGVNSAGATANGANDGALLLANEASLGLKRPIGRGIIPAQSDLRTAGGFVHRSRYGCGSQAWELNFELMRGAGAGGTDYEWWKIQNSYDAATDALYTNPGWYKGVWLTLDDWGNDTNRTGYYLVPSGPLLWQITHAGGRVSATITFESPTRG